MYKTRAIEPLLKKIANSFKVMLVTGPRQVGKTTTLKSLAEPDRKYVTLDDIRLRTLAKEDPPAFLERFSPPVIIDEIQYAPELLPYIKIIVDNNNSTGQFWLTGSQQFNIMKDVSESLAGRIGIAQMLGFSRAETYSQENSPLEIEYSSLINRFEAHPKTFTTMQIFEDIIAGCMPALLTNPDTPRDIFYSSYIDTYIKRDIREIVNVESEYKFEKFMISIAARTARTLNYDEIAREVEVTAPTVKKWVSLLKSTHIIELVHPYSNNLLTRTIKNPQVHFLDLGLCAALLNWHTAQTLERGAMAGQFFESYIFSEIYKNHINNGLTDKILYYRDKDQKEIDLIIESDQGLHPIEVKKTSSPSKKMVSAFNLLKGKTNLKTGLIITMANEVYKVDEDVINIPAWVV